MLVQRCVCVCMLLVVFLLVGSKVYCVEERRPYRILLDTDVDRDDIFALLYLLKLNKSEFDLQAVTINTNTWTDAGHSVNQVYDILYMMGRDDISVGVGGEGSILEDGTILPNVGGYHPIIEQGNGTAGYCRYRQAIPVGSGGKLDIDTNFGLRKSFLPQGSRRYLPLRQPTAQQVMIEKISAGPITVFVIGANTNLGIFLMSNPHLKKNIEHIYIMGGGVRSKNPTGCCPKTAESSCQPRQCGDKGNIFSDYNSNPYAEFNMFGDPFAAYQSYFMWDSFLSGVATSIMLNHKNHNGENEFAVMEYMNITVITSNEPYGISDGSNPLFDGNKKPRFGLKRNGVHSGHVQTGLRDPFCIVKNGKGRCKDGYTAEVTGGEGARVLVAIRAKPNSDRTSPLNREFFKSFLDIVNRPQQSGRFNFTTQFLDYKEVLYKPDLKGKQLGKNVIFDMDMSAGDFLALFYLLKMPIEVINLKAILVTPTGWANAATIDVIYDLLHMMGRDDVPIGLGDVFPLNQSDHIFSAVGGCNYNRAIPHGSGGFLDSDTLYGLARDLPRSPRRYTVENSVKFGAPRDTDHPELRQPLALEIWQSVVKSLKSQSKVTILTNGPLTNIANIILSDKTSTSFIEEIFVVGGHINDEKSSIRGNVINIPSNKNAELNMFLDPLAAKTVFDHGHNITLIPLRVQRRVSRFAKILESLRLTKKTPEALFARRLISKLHRLQRTHHRYQHVDTFSGEILGAVILAGDHSVLNATFGVKKVQVLATGVESEDGQITIGKNNGNSVRILKNVDSLAYYNVFANQLGEEKQSAVVGSFEEQRRQWNRAQN
ncbi:nucleoside hydrolase 3-like isoform X2 [Primulina eburnea]|uniref:nucleoside hydrolase 3-like isoform X2 n=1 Tax=Primulina eburnea TaxID=1245227 RepID=UPI003C6BF8FC